MAFLKKIGLAISYLAALIVIIIALGMSIASLSTPFLNKHIDEFEKWAGELLKTPVKINSVHVSWYYYKPVLDLEQVVILDETQKPTFSIKEIRINLSFLQSLFQRKPILDYIKIAGVNVRLDNLTPGQINVAGVGHFNITDNVTGGADEANDVVNLILSQAHLVLDDIEIHYIDAKGIALSLTLDKLSLQNSGNHHSLKGMARVNQKIPTTLEIKLNWIGRSLNPAEITANAYIYVEGFSLPQWLSRQTWNNLHVKQGLGSAKIWANWQNNSWAALQTELQFFDVELFSEKTLKTQFISRVSGNFNWKQQNNEYSIQGDSILIDLPKHIWPTTGFSINLSKQPDNTFQLKTVQIDYVDLDDLMDIALASGLLPEEIENKLLDWNPEGEVRQFNLNLTDQDHLLTNSLTMELLNVAIYPKEDKWPTIAHLTGQLSWDGKKGKIALKSNDFIFADHQIFAHPLQFDNVSATIDLQKDDHNNWSFITKNLTAYNDHMQGNASLNLQLLAQGDNHIDLSGTFSMKDAAMVTHYLPMKIFHGELQDWLNDAFHGGKITDGKAILQGNLADFPFEKGNGKFLISGKVNDLDFCYASEWPMIERLSGELTFLNDSMSVDVTGGNILNIPLHKVHAQIPQLSSDPELTVNGEVAGDLVNGQQFILMSPLQKKLGKDFQNLKLSGSMQLTLGLVIPLKNVDNTSVNGDIVVNNSHLALPAYNIHLSGLSGNLHFTQDDIVAEKLQGFLFNEPIVLSIMTQHPANQTSVIQAKMQGTLSVAHLQNWLQMDLSNYLQGSTAFSAELNLTDGALANQLTINTNLQGVKVNLPLNYSKAASEIRPLQLNIFFNAKDSLKINANYSQTDLQMTQTTSAWKAFVKSNDFVGDISLPTDWQAGVIEANLQYLNLKSMGSVGQALNPRNLPNISFVTNSLKYNDQVFGSLSFNIQKSAGGILIKDLNLKGATYSLSANGSWTGSDKGSQTQLQGNLNARNVADFLQQFGVKSSNLIGSGGYAQFNFVWPNAPYNPDLATLTGSLGLKLTAGQIINLGQSTDAKMGFGKMLNILSLQTIPHLLTFDFKGIFSKGYAFDYMKGDFRFASGSIFTDNAVFDGSLARIEIAGRVGLVAKDYNIQLNVTPYVTGSLPVVAAIAVNPLVGVAAWAVEKVAEKAVSKVTTYKYNITGPWSNPVWNKR